MACGLDAGPFGLGPACPVRRNPRWGCWRITPPTQGSARRATPGSVAQSLWDRGMRGTRHGAGGIPSRGTPLESQPDPGSQPKVGAPTFALGGGRLDPSYPGLVIKHSSITGILRACLKNTPGRLAAGPAGWLRCASVTDFSRICSLVAPRHPASRARNPPVGLFLRQALRNLHSD